MVDAKPHNYIHVTVDDGKFRVLTNVKDYVI